MRQQARFRSTSTTVWTYVGQTALVAQRRGMVLDTHFDVFHEDVNAQPGLTGIIVLAHDGAPPPRQRAAIQEWFRKGNMRGAVLTNSLLARGGVTALSWLGATICAFRRDELEAAIEFVRVAPSHREQTLQVLRALDAECP